MPHNLFSNDFIESRARFCTAVAQAGGTLMQWPLPDHYGPSGEELTFDVGIVGNTSSRKVLLMSAAVHGSEGPVGAAIILDYLEQIAATEKDLKVILVHAINPWGMAHGLRGNESNVDLNRNFIDHHQGRAPNTEYAAVHAALCQPDLSAALDWVDELFRAPDSASASRTISAIYKGQYTHPDGIGYGGQSSEWSIKVLQEALEMNTSDQDLIVHIDWHTGMGTYAQALPVSFHAPDSLAAQHLQAWYGTSVTRFDTAFATGEAPDFSGVIAHGLIGARPADRYFGVVIEFGTVENHRIIRSFVIDQWLRYNKHSNRELERWARQQIAEAYCPVDVSWRAQVVASGRSIINRIATGVRALAYTGEIT